MRMPFLTQLPEIVIKPLRPSQVPKGHFIYNSVENLFW